MAGDPANIASSIIHQMLFFQVVATVPELFMIVDRKID